MLEPIRARFDALIADPRPGREDWSWCDALFMAPPVLAGLSAATGDPKYLNFMNTMWWDTTEHLYDTEDHLFYRDARYMRQPDGSWPLRSPKDGSQGVGIVLSESPFLGVSDSGEHHLVVTEAEVGSPVTYYAGSCWDKSADFSGVSDWEAYLAEYAQRVRSPLKVTLSQE